MASSRLWVEARIDFETRMRQNSKDASYSQALDEFLIQNDNPNATSLSAKRLAEEASRKWDDSKIPKKWVNKIMSNIDQFTKAASSAMDFAPESVKLAWFGINLTLSAIKSNYDLYALFGAGLTDITDVLILALHHDRLYDERMKPSDGFKSSDLLDKLFQDIRKAYALVLEFSFSVKRHLHPDLGRRLVHGFKHIMGLFKDKFQGILKSITSTKEDILDDSQAVFQDRAITDLSSIKSIVSDIEDTTRDIKHFQDDLQEMKKNQFESFEIILGKLEVLSSSTKPKTPWELALQELEANMESLEIKDDATRKLEEAMSRRFPNTCKWIFEDQDYLRWIQSPKNGILWLTGNEGSGKSIILGTVVGHLSAQSTIESNGAETMIIHFSSKTPEQMAGTDSPSVEKVCNGLLYQLCCLVRGLSAESTDVGLVESCNEVLRHSNTATNMNMSFMQDDNTKKPEFVHAFTNIAEMLKINVVVALDEVDSLNPAEQQELAFKLQSLAGSAKKTSSSQTWLKFLVAWHQAQDCSDKGLGSICIDIERRSKGDRETVISAELEKVTGLTSDERKEAKEAILKKAGSWFTYVNEIGIPFMREPFQRPLSKHLESLPEGMNTIYREALDSMRVSYVSLLREALRWCLLSKVPVPAEVVMDAYHGRYSKNGSEPHATEIRDDSGKFPGISSLEAKQLRYAGGPFLQLDNNNLIRLRNGRQVREFCLDIDEAASGYQGTNHARCTQCKASTTMSDSVIISRKKDHLHIALTCLRHLNSPLYQKRSMVHGTLRYEAMFWTRHLRIAEGLWTSDERKESKEWSLILKELSCFFYSKGSAEVEFLTWWHTKTENAESLVPPLHTAAGFGLCFWAEYLLEELKEDPDSFLEMPEPKTGKTGRLYPLHFAAGAGTEGSPHMHELLLRYGANTNADTRIGIPIFLYWMMKGPSFVTVKLMLDYGADHTVHSWDGFNALHMLAAKGNDADALELLLSSRFEDRKLDINHAPNRFLFSPLHSLVSAQSIPIDLLRAFLKHGADVNAETCDSRRPLHFVSSRGNLEALKILCDKQIISDVDDPDSVGGTALFAATKGNHTDCMQFLLELKGDVNKTNNLGQTPLHVAALEGNVEAVKVLLDHGVDVGRVDKVNTTALLDACKEGKRAAETTSLILEWMIKEDLPLFQINGKSDDKWTLLSRASCFGFETIVQRLIELAKDRNDMESLAVDSQKAGTNLTALHLASECGSLECNRWLLEAGASLTMVDNKGRTALVVAHEAWTLRSHLASFPEIISMMIEKDPTAAIKDAELVATCALHGNVDLLELLHQHNADFGRQDGHGWTPLQLAKNSQHLDAIHFLEHQDVWGGRLPSYWPPFPLDSSTVISDDGLGVCHSMRTTRSVFADKPVPPGLRRFYFELTLEKPPEQVPIQLGQVSVGENPGVAIGFCTSRNSTMIQYPGWTPKMFAPMVHSWGYHGYDGGLFEGKGRQPDLWETPYKSGMTVGCGVDTETHHIWFTCNGRKLDSELENVHGRLYPTIGLQFPTKVRANFKGPFMWQEGSDADRAPSLRDAEDCRGKEQRGLL